MDQIKSNREAGNISPCAVLVPMGGDDALAFESRVKTLAGVFERAGIRVAWYFAGASEFSVPECMRKYDATFIKISNKANLWQDLNRILEKIEEPWTFLFGPEVLLDPAEVQLLFGAEKNYAWTIATRYQHTGWISAGLALACSGPVLDLGTASLLETNTIKILASKVRRRAPFFPLRLLAMAVDEGTAIGAVTARGFSGSSLVQSLGYSPKSFFKIFFLRVGLLAAATGVAGGSLWLSKDQATIGLFLFCFTTLAAAFLFGKIDD